MRGGESGFDGTLVPGIVYGLRAFGVTEDGWLTGCTFTVPWQVGVNHAQCLQDVPTSRYGGMTPMHRRSHPGYTPPFYMSPYGVRDYVPDSIETPAPVALDEHPEHKLHGCHCGFYSYFGLANSYGMGHEKRLSGIIAGWGRVYAGRRGFRCTKAMLMALVIPDFDPAVADRYPYVSDLHAAFSKVRDRYQVRVFPTLDDLLTLGEHQPDTYESVRASRRVVDFDEEAA